jgi:hypothetical protein
MNGEAGEKPVMLNFVRESDVAQNHGAILKKETARENEFTLPELPLIAEFDGNPPEPYAPVGIIILGKALDEHDVIVGLALIACRNVHE